MAGFLPNSLIEVTTQPQELDEFILQTSGSTSVDKINYTNLLKGALRPSDIGVSVQPYDANTLTSETNTSLSFSTNILTYTDETGASTNIDLSLYLDTIAGAVSDLVVDGTETVAGNANKINELLASLRTAGLLAV